MLGTLVDVTTYRDFIQHKQYYMCIHCKLNYPVIDGEVRCNGVEIITCPWCGEDSPTNALAREDHLKRGG